jgi:hypothetical protein
LEKEYKVKSAYLKMKKVTLQILKRLTPKPQATRQGEAPEAQPRGSALPP